MPFRVAAAALTALLLPAPGAAAAPRIGVAQVTDERPRGAVTEIWRWRVDDPDARRTVELRIGPHYVEVRRFELDWRLNRDVKLYTRPQPYRRGRLRFSGPDGEAVLTHRRGGLHLRIKHRLASADVTFSRVARGPRALGWRFPSGPAHPAGSLSWSMPVATARARGSIAFEARRIDVSGWRGTYEHLWGSLDLEWSSWDHLQTYVSFERGGAATVLMGAAESFRPLRDRRDARWKGVLAAARPSGTRVCRARVRRSRWRESVDRSGVAQIAAAAGCRGVRATRFVVPDRWYLGGRSFTDGYDEADGYLRGSRSGWGWTRQFNHS